MATYTTDKTLHSHSLSVTRVHIRTPNTFNQPTYTLEGVRACGEAVPGGHSRLCQSDPSAHPKVTCKGTTTIKVTEVSPMSLCRVPQIWRSTDPEYKYLEDLSITQTFLRSPPPTVNKSHLRGARHTERLRHYQEGDFRRKPVFLYLENP